MITHYTRYLPHILPADETFFITFRLHGSLPENVISQLREERKVADAQFQPADKSNSGKRYFARFDAFLDTYAEGNNWLKQPEIADLVKQGIHYHHERSYILHAYCIMSNHVHLLVTALPRQNSFFNVLKSLKGFTARQANVLLNRTGQPMYCLIVLGNPSGSRRATIMSFAITKSLNGSFSISFIILLKPG